MANRLGREPECEQLGARHDSMLPPSQLPRPFTPRFQNLGPHRGSNAGNDASLPLCSAFVPEFGCLRRCGLEARGVSQGLGAVGALPGEVVVGAAEVAVGGGLLEDRAVEVEVLAEGAGAHVELGLD